VQARHVLMLRFKRHRIEARRAGQGLVGIQTGLARRYQQRTLGGVALDLPVALFAAQQRIVAEHASAQQRQQGGMIAGLDG